MAGRDLLDAGADWRRVSWKSHGTAEPDSEVHVDGGSSFRLSDDAANDIRLVRRIAVKAGRFYRFSARVRTEDVVGRVGANLSIDGTYNRSRIPLTGTTGWTRVQQVFRATQSDRLAFALRLGYWNATARGTAWFDQVELEELETWQGDYEPVRRSVPHPKVSAFPLRLLTLLFVVPFLYGGLAWLRHRPGSPGGPASATRPLWMHAGFWLLIAAGLVARLLFLRQPGPWVEPPALEAWALHLAGAFGASPGTTPAELPAPLWLYWLGLVGAVVKGLVLENSRVFTGLLQMPAIVVELLVLAAVLRYLRGRLSAGAFWLSAGFVVFHPALLLGTALAGLPAAAGAGLVLLSFFALQVSRPLASGLLLGLGVAAAPVMLWLVPPILVWSWSRWGGRKTGGLAVVGGAVLLASVIPVVRFYAQGDVLSVAAGLAGGFPGNTVAALATAFLGIATWLVVLVFVYRRIAGKRALASQVPGGEGAVSPLVAQGLLVISLTLMAVVTGPESAVLYLTVVVGGLLLGERGLWRWSFFLVGLLASWYWGHEYISATIADTGRAAEGSVQGLARLGIALLAVLSLWEMSGPATGARSGLSWRNGVARWTARARGFTRPQVADPVAKFRVALTDVVLLVAIWLAGFLLIVHDMGERVYPLNAYQVEAPEEVFEVIFPRPIRLAEVRVYTGAKGTAAARFEVADDGGWKTLWKADEGRLRYKGGQRARRSTFKQLWRRVATDKAIERVRVTLIGAEADINEIVFLDKDLQVLAPRLLERKEPAGVPVAAATHPLFDEGHRITAEKSFRAKTYWDEVYYARSGYELANGRTPYERSHPPLGKILISWGVDMFGMTPFGWRFMDAFVVSLLPVVLWVAARGMFGLRHAAYAAAFLAVFELMFFVHGRWANIDTFLAFFLTVSLLSLFFWYRKSHGRFARENLGWFLASGAAFGCAVATKWSALFTGFAVFVLWAIAQISAIARHAAGPTVERGTRLARYFRKELPINVMAWGAVFVALPALIYYSSYAPILETLPGAPRPLSVEGWRTFVDQQLFQLHFHADKETGHSSSSMFFTWPLMLQPASMLTLGGVPSGTRATINILGNPVIWWTGLAAMLALGWRALRGRDEIAVFLAGIYFLQGLPWLLVTRTTYLYHYLPFLPLLILGIVYWLARLDVDRRAVRVAFGMFALLVVAGFVAYYPYVTGMPVPVAYTEAVRIFDDWSRL